MPREFTRGRRLEEQIQRIVSDILRAEMRDPRLSGIIVTHVKLSGDLGVAWIYFSELSAGAGGQGQEAVSEALAKAAGFVRRQLARQLQIRSVPEVRFLPDEAQGQATRLDALIDQALATGARPGRGEVAAPEADPGSAGKDGDAQKS